MKERLCTLDIRTWKLASAACDIIDSVAAMTTASLCYTFNFYIPNVADFCIIYMLFYTTEEANDGKKLGSHKEFWELSTSISGSSLTESS